MSLVLKSMPEWRGGDTDGGEVRGEEVVFGEAKEQIGLADPRVADDEQLDQIVIALLSLHAALL
jgi:hypothetical protein